MYNFDFFGNFKQIYIIIFQSSLDLNLHTRRANRIRSASFGSVQLRSLSLSPLEEDDSGDAGRPAVCFVFGHEIHVTAGGCWWRHATFAATVVTATAIGRRNALAAAHGQSLRP